MLAPESILKSCYCKTKRKGVSNKHFLIHTLSSCTDTKMLKPDLWEQHRVLNTRLAGDSSAQLTVRTLWVLLTSGYFHFPALPKEIPFFPALEFSQVRPRTSLCWASQFPSDQGSLEWACLTCISYSSMWLHLCSFQMACQHLFSLHLVWTEGRNTLFSFSCGTSTSSPSQSTQG